MSVFKKAFAEDAGALSQLALHSEAYLGYDFEYMKKFSDLYTVTGEFINQNPVYILEDEGTTVGFWGLNKKNNSWELEFFYIASAHIGKSYGNKLWKHLIEKCKEIGVTEFHFVTSPHSAPFYEKMGAVVIEHIESLIISGRMIPRLKYTI